MTTPRHPDSGQFVRDELAGATAAHAAGERASHDRQGHYAQNVTGQASAAGDPMPAESALTPPEPPPPLSQRRGRQP